MKYDDLIVLIPSHSLEDFPTELPDEDAEGLLNAFAAAWHPLLLASAGVLPSWHRADEPPSFLQNRLIFVPRAAADWIPHGWVERARGDGAAVVSGLYERGEMLAAALEPLGLDAAADPDLAADFLALGACWLQLELLTRYMHHFSNLDEVYLQREAVAAAKAAVADDAHAARSHLKSCFDVLLEARERFYPVDCYVLDLCLLIPRLADEHLTNTLAGKAPVNIVATAADLREIAAERPDAIAALRSAWAAGGLDLCGGDAREAPLPLLPVSSLLWEFSEGGRIFQELFGRTPTTWGRRMYGLSTLLPQVLHKFGFHSALHLVMDDGLYPDAEQSKIRWEGCDGTVIDAVSRIPLAADASASWLRFPMRMSESMEMDHVAAVLLARWPEVRSPFFEDFRRMQAYAPVLGRCVTLAEFFQHSDDPGRLSSYAQGEYFTPALLQAVARQEADPISRFVEHLDRRSRFDAAGWCGAVADVLIGRTSRDDALPPIERLLEQAGPGGAPDRDARDRAEAMLAEWPRTCAARLAGVILHRGGRGSGVLVVNHHSFARTVALELPMLAAPPALSDTVKAVQFDGRRRTAVVQLPASGFVWLEASSGRPAADASHAHHAAGASQPPLAEDLILRNEHFEVFLNEATGGIARIKGYGRMPNRLSQQLAFRFSQERALETEDDVPAVRTFYSEMRCRSFEVLARGPAVGEIRTSGEIVDQQDDAVLAGFVQTVRVWRFRPVVELDIELDVRRMPEGDPWSNYFAARFAWNDPSASLTRSVQEGAHPVGGERIETSHYLEIASEDERTTIIPGGLPFHRRTGLRMLDSILVVEGESRRRFRFTIAVDQDYPLQAALDALSPPIIVPTEAGPPASGASGWFFHLNVKSVQLTRVLPVCGVEDPDDGSVQAVHEQHDRPHAPPEFGCCVRLQETEGRRAQVRLRCFRTPSTARRLDFRGRRLGDLPIEDDAIQVDVGPYEIVDVELAFSD